MPSRYVGEVDSRICADEAVAGLDDLEFTTLAQDPHGLGLNEPPPCVEVFGVDVDKPAFCFGDDLLGYDDDVSLFKARVRGYEVGYPIARLYLRDALHGKDLEAVWAIYGHGVSLQ